MSGLPTAKNDWSFKDSSTATPPPSRIPNWPTIPSTHHPAP
jgi:hypothetical protein